MGFVVRDRAEILMVGISASQATFFQVGCKGLVAGPRLEPVLHRPHGLAERFRVRGRNGSPSTDSFTERPKTWVIPA